MDEARMNALRDKINSIHLANVLYWRQGNQPNRDALLKACEQGRQQIKGEKRIFQQSQIVSARCCNRMSESLVSKLGFDSGVAV